MEVTVQIPDTIRDRLGKDSDELPRWILEKAGLEVGRLNWPICLAHFLDLSNLAKIQ